MIWKILILPKILLQMATKLTMLLCVSSQSSQSCARSSFFSVFYVIDALAEVKDNNPDDTLECDDGEYWEEKCGEIGTFYKF